MCGSICCCVEIAHELHSYTECNKMRGNMLTMLVWSWSKYFFSESTQHWLSKLFWMTCQLTDYFNICMEAMDIFIYAVPQFWSWQWKSIVRSDLLANQRTNHKVSQDWHHANFMHFSLFAIHCLLHQMCPHAISFPQELVICSRRSVKCLFVLQTACWH